MTIGELKEKIADIPDEVIVFIDERRTEFTYGIVNGTTRKEVDIYEDAFTDEEPLSTVDAFILSED